MLTDARSSPEEAAIAADICIVGAGAAGITLARELAASNRRIALFAALRALKALIRADFSAGRAARIKGWILSRTEARLCALFA